MGDSQSVITRYADKPNLTAPTTYPSGNNQAAICASPYGEAYDIAIPAGDGKTANQVLLELAKNWNDLPDDHLYKAALKIEASTVAGELYIKQVEVARERFTQLSRAIAEDYGKTGKYTPAHTAKILEARDRLKAELADVFPGLSRFRSVPANRILKSDKITSDLNAKASNVDSLTGKTQGNAARNIVKRGKDLTYADDVIVLADSKLANKLSKINRFSWVIEFIPSAAVLVASENDKERETALAQLIAKGTGAAAGQITQRVGLALCVVFGVSTGGWGFLACGLVTVAAGIYLGDYVEKKMTPILKPN